MSQLAVRKLAAVSENLSTPERTAVNSATEVPSTFTVKSEYTELWDVLTASPDGMVRDREDVTISARSTWTLLLTSGRYVSSSSILSPFRSCSDISELVDMISSLRFLERDRVSGFCIIVAIAVQR